MQLTVVGLNPKPRPLSIREKLAFAAANLPDAVSNLARSEAAEEAVILSTCNRTELCTIGETEKNHQLVGEISRPVRRRNPPLPLYPDNNENRPPRLPRRLGLIPWSGRTANSRSNQRCRPRCARTESINTHLNALFQNLCRCQRSAYRYAVGENSVSMTSASVKMAEQIFLPFPILNILFIGAGEMIELVATYFAAKNPKLITVANRTHQRAQELCDKLCSTPSLPAERITRYSSRLDMVVSSTASQLPRRQRHGRAQKKPPTCLFSLLIWLIRAISKPKSANLKTHILYRGRHDGHCPKR